MSEPSEEKNQAAGPLFLTTDLFLRTDPVFANCILFSPRKR